LELTNFRELEEKIKIVVSEYELLKKRNQELETFLDQKNTELEEANKNIRGLKEERDFIRTKVDSLLNLLQDIHVPS
jgi:chromosome segregation ATPase